MELDLGLSTGWDSAEAGHVALGLSRVLGGELAVEGDEALGARGAVAVDVAPETPAALGENAGLDAGPDSVLDTDRVPKVAVVADTGGALGLGFALGAELDVGPEVDTAAAMAQDIARIAGVDGVDMGQHTVSGPGRRRRRKAVERSSRSRI